jgi:hypothetical protein
VSQLPGSSPAWQRLLWPLRTLGVVASALLLAYLNGHVQPLLASVLLGTLGAFQAVAGLALWHAHTRSVGRERVRLRFMFAAFACGVLPVSLLMLSGPGSPGFEPGALQWPLATLFLAYLLSYLGLGYGVLRHRVFDLYLVFDHALVYAIALVPITGVIFALKHLAGLPFMDWYHSLGDSNEARLIQGGGLVAAYLAGHFTFHWLDHHVQHLVFHHRHQRASQLRQFLQEAQHITGQEALLRGLHQQLERFSEGAGNAIYLRLSGGDFAQVFNSIARAPHLLEGDDALLVKMRRQPVVRWLDSGESTSEAVGALALPMLRRGAVSGLVVMGQRRNGEAYRPDEVELLREVVEHVSLDLQAIAAARWEQTGTSGGALA